jgi:hypothetical protein
MLLHLEEIPQKLFEEISIIFSFDGSALLLLYNLSKEDFTVVRHERR